MNQAQTMITVEMPDGCFITYDKLRRNIILTGKKGVTTMTMLPARPNPPGASAGGIGGMMGKPAAPARPIEKSGFVEKLGHKKKPILGTEIWNRRYIILTPTQLSYHVSESEGPKGVITLNKGIKCQVLRAHEAAMKDRFETGDNPGAMKMMTMNISQLADKRGSAIGRDYCVEMHVPPQIGNILGTIGSQSAMGLAFGGGAKEINKNIGRTYYFQCESLFEAEEWVKAIQNNVDCLPEADTSGIQNRVPGQGAGGFAGIPDAASLNNMVNNAMGMANAQNDCRDPAKSLKWYKNMLGTALSEAELYPYVCQFHDKMEGKA